MTELLPRALQYGMTTEEFWHNDKRLFWAYEKAYYRRQYETAWLNGLYIDVALNTLVRNVFAKKGSKPLKYPDKPVDPFEKKVVLSESEKEKQFRDSIKKLDWLKQGIKKEK